MQSYPPSRAPGLRNANCKPRAKHKNQICLLQIPCHSASLCWIILFFYIHMCLDVCLYSFVYVDWMAEGWISGGPIFAAEIEILFYIYWLSNFGR
jgi:hypothetical protein